MISNGRLNHHKAARQEPVPAKLVGAPMGEASAVLIDQLIEDQDSLRDLERVDHHDIANTLSCPDCRPATPADKYDVRFAQQFRVIASDMTGALVHGWTRPSCAHGNWRSAAFFDQVESFQDLL